jgi:peroxiredoxin Q/BCP
MYGKKSMGVLRATFLIDKEGKIAHIWPKVKVEGHVNEVLETIKNLA